MNYKNWLKKHLIKIMAGSLLVTSSTTTYFVYETITTNNELSSLQTDFSQQVQINLDLTDVIAQLELDKSKLNQDLALLNTNYSNLLIVKSNLEKNIADLASEKTELNKEISDLNSELVTLNDEIKTLETRITSLNSQIAASAAALSSLSSQLGSLSSQNSQLSSQVSSLTVQVNNYITENASQIDFAQVNQISQLVMKANIRVNVPITGGTSIGSGVVYKYSSSGGNIYFALTNNHVVKNFSGVGTITVNNYAGTSFNATKVAFNDNADLAILQITGNSVDNFHVLSLEPSNYVLANDTKVISLGGPSLQLNTITLGKITNNNASVTITNDKSYTGVIAHNAVINKGSSGGTLINFDNKIVGINFAGDFTGQPDPQPFPYQNVNGYAIDLAKIYALLGSGNAWSLS